MTVVLDASAVLAVLFGEAGRETVLAHGQGGHISAVNLVEVLTRAIDRGVPEAVRNSITETLALQVVDFDAVTAVLAAELRGSTRHLGLSLADRACLALGRKLNLPVLTGDSAWTSLDIGIEIVLIR